MAAAAAMAVASLAGAFSGCAPTTLRTVHIEDPRGDDHGPGDYAYPDGYRAGGFDIVGTTLALRDDATVAITVRFAGKVPVRRAVRLANDLVVDVFLPTVDLYLDLDGKAGTGAKDLLAGRRARLAGPGGWEMALVLSPVPVRVAELLEDPSSAGPRVAGVRVRVVRRVVVRSDRLVAVVPASLFGEAPLEEIGVAVVVSGTVYDTTFRTEVEAQVRTHFVREVTEQAGRCGRWEEAIDGAPCTFGGCGACVNHPRLIDVLHPTPGAQEEALSRYIKGGLGEVPMVYRGTAAPKAAPLPVGDVIERKGAILTVRSPATLNLPKVTPGKLLDGLDEAGSVKATLVVVSVVPTPGEAPAGTIIVRVVDGKAGLVRRVRFPADTRL